MARDFFHNAVRQALEADGWTITDDPLVIKTGGLQMELDLAAERVLAAERGNERIAVEIKSFLNKIKLYDFYQAKGQYDVYRLGLSKVDTTRALFLAIEEDVFNSFFQKPLIQETVAKDQIALIVFSQTENRIVSWIK